MVCSVSEMHGSIETCRCHRQKDRVGDGETRFVLPQAFRAFAIVYLWGMFDSLAVTAFDYIFLYYVDVFILSFIYC